MYKDRGNKGYGRLREQEKFSVVRVQGQVEREFEDKIIKVDVDRFVMELLY